MISTASLPPAKNRPITGCRAGPWGVIPFAGAVNSCVIAANTMAKRAGVTTGMAIADARRRCQGIALVPQQPDLYTRVHHRIVAAVLDVLPIDAVCSIDEFAATVEPRDIPAALTHQIKQRLRDAVGDHITCSIGYAPNRWLAKIAADLDKAGWPDRAAKSQTAQRVRQRISAVMKWAIAMGLPPLRGK